MDQTATLILDFPFQSFVACRGWGGEEKISAKLKIIDIFILFAFFVFGKLDSPGIFWGRIAHKSYAEFNSAYEGGVMGLQKDL